MIAYQTTLFLCLNPSIQVVMRSLIDEMMSSNYRFYEVRGTSDVGVSSPWTFVERKINIDNRELKHTR